jgi:hypothetical protein
LAKYAGCESGKKKTHRISSNSWLLTETYHPNWVFGIFFPLKSGEFGPFFPLQILCIARNHIFQAKIW